MVLRTATSAGAALAHSLEEPSMTSTGLCVAIGLAAGTLSGLVGIGGGIVMVPALVLLLGLSQHEAQGTTLAMMVPPVGLAAAWTYYRAGYIDLRFAGWLCLGFVVGTLVGSRIAIAVSDVTLERIFGAALLVVGLKMILVR
ncbi:MAG: sulfite exporter TauE/SafE family protein [Pirellulales bacterium]|nr:sulfite exporter TauE/SafE family protein [Pirellulales bacterium]